MEVRYYQDTNTAYIYLLEPGTQVKVEESEEVAPGVVVDFDADERPVGIEIYDGAREKLAGAPISTQAEDLIRREERKRIANEMEQRLLGASRMFDAVVAELVEEARRSSSGAEMPSRLGEDGGNA